MPAATANLRASDLDPRMNLAQEYGPPDFPLYPAADISQRLFVSAEVTVQSRVTNFDYVLQDTAEDRDKWGQDELAMEFEGIQLSVEEGQAVSLGSLAIMHKFADNSARSEGWLLTFESSNALVTLILYGPHS